jgi:LPS-assembly lipoprotein
LGACGFSPLYAKRTQKDMGYSWAWQKNVKTSFVRDELAKIYIKPIADRVGQVLRNELKDLINTKGAPVNSDYVLYVTLEDSLIRQGLQSDDTATRETIFYTASYNLKQKQNVLLSGETRSEVGYNLLENPYASVSSVNDAKKRAAKILAKDIAIRLSVYFDMIEKDKIGAR